MIEIDILLKTMQDGGSSTSLKDEILKNQGYMVALEKKELVLNKLSSKDIRTYINKHIKKLLEKNIFLGHG